MTHTSIEIIDNIVIILKSLSEVNYFSIVKYHVYIYICMYIYICIYIERKSYIHVYAIFVYITIFMKYRP